MSEKLTVGVVNRSQTTRLEKQAQAEAVRRLDRWMRTRTYGFVREGWEQSRPLFNCHYYLYESLLLILFSIQI